MTIQVQSYGLHRSPEGVNFLHQKGPTGHNYIGWKKPSPFELVFENRPLCPHAINTSVGHPDQFHWETFIDLYEDPFFRACLPLPRKGTDLIPFLADKTYDGKWVTMAFTLSRLSSPVMPIVLPWGRKRTKDLAAELRLTNVAPLILYGVNTEHQNELNELVLEATGRIRKLVIIGAPEVVVRYPMERITSTLDVMHDPHKLLSLPLESLGSVALRRYARGEQVNAPFIKREAHD